MTPNRLRVAGSASMPSSRSGEERWKKLSACDCTICARFRCAAAGWPFSGMRTARMASQALAEASRWLTGQMPQMRAISEGISEKGRPSQNFSKPRNWVTWKWASSTRPSSSRWIEILEWPSMRVTGSITIFCRDMFYPNLAAGLTGPSLPGDRSAPKKSGPRKAGSRERKDPPGPTRVPAGRWAAARE